jgi:Protein of unknown function (DUF1572)
VSSEAQLLRDLRILLLRDLRAFRREIELFPDDESPWRPLPGIANPAANLALHAAGNLRYFVGSLLGHSGYRRDREAEFGRQGGTRAELAAELERAGSEVDRALGALLPQCLSEPFPETLRGLQASTGTILLHLATHLAFHLGQAGYHRRALLGESRSSGAMSVDELKDGA